MAGGGDVVLEAPAVQDIADAGEGVGDEEERGWRVEVEVSVRPAPDCESNVEGVDLTRVVVGVAEWHHQFEMERGRGGGGGDRQPEAGGGGARVGDSRAVCVGHQRIGWRVGDQLGYR